MLEKGKSLSYFKVDGKIEKVISSLEILVDSFQQHLLVVLVGDVLENRYDWISRKKLTLIINEALISSPLKIASKLRSN